jgi:hypothetical protein
MPRIYTRVPVEQRFWQYVRKTETCWLWTGATREWGYGVLFLEKIGGISHTERAHRLSWQMHRGPIPSGLFVCHHCDVPACVNPEHLFIGTCADNNQDMAAKDRCDRVKRPKGELHGNAVLTEKIVLRIRREYRPNVPLRVYAERYGTSLQTIWSIVHRKGWKHI